MGIAGRVSLLIVASGVCHACGDRRMAGEPGGDVDDPRPDAAAADAAAGAIADATLSDAVNAPDAGSTPDAGGIAPDAATADANGNCATPPTGDWTGVARIRGNGSGGYDQVQASVQWTLVASIGCVDHYQPSGTATVSAVASGCQANFDPPSGAIEPADGELTIDRTTAPATYQLHGESSWDAVVSDACDDDPPGPPHSVGGEWADNHGSFDSDAFGGRVIEEDLIYFEVDWHFNRDGAVFTPPGDGCSEPASEQWSSVNRMASGAEAMLTWTRVSTTGCLDRFEPHGTATATPPLYPNCVAIEYEPSHQVVPADGILEVDRSTDPATFHVSGETNWEGTKKCTHADDTVEITQGTIGGRWAASRGPFDGDRFGGGFTYGYDALEWRFTRLE